MPVTFKKAAIVTDAGIMSDTVVEGDANNQFLLDGDLPRLGESQPMLPNLPPASAFTNVDGGPTVPVVSPVLTDGAAPALPTLPAPAAEALPIADASAPAPTAPRHPMAHLMPEKLQPSESSIRAAEIRAAKKAKARKIKIGVAIGAVAFTAVVGPPVARWTIDAINEAGSTKPDEPEPTVAPADEAETDAKTEAESTPQAGLEAIEDAKQLTDGTAPAPTVP
jgi:hypothetical protein